ncbi:MAG: helix-turn-helix transcriptional regulator [Acidobacteria bacterium]|nr:helix-turn-helix transcriptional regulator [Acidobacteriota bacterium]
MLKNFGQFLEQQRMEAQLSVSELASLAGMAETRLSDWEQGAGEPPNFDACYRLGQVLTARSGRGFIVQDLWQALRADKLEASF